MAKRTLLTVEVEPEKKTEFKIKLMREKITIKEFMDQVITDYLAGEYNPDIKGDDEN